MTNNAADRVMEYMATLWPEWGANTEQLGIWHGYLVEHDEHVVMDATKRYFADSKWKRPVLVDLLAWVRKVKNERGTIAKQEADAPLTYAEITRQNWIAREKHREAEFNAMSDTEVELKAAQIRLERAVQVYGSGQPEVRDCQREVDQWRERWQNEQDGVEPEDFTGSWSDWQREHGSVDGGVFVSVMHSSSCDMKRLPPARVVE